MTAPTESGLTSLAEVEVTRYLLPLREGGSLPGVVEGDDLGTYVCKFARAGQGPRVLVAEVIASGLAELIGLRTPRLARLTLSSELARYEADEEVQDLLVASVGSNLGVDFLPGAFGYDAPSTAGDEVAGKVLWLDAFTANVDRSWRNPNLLVWHSNVWVIDHGASLYFHHGWSGGVGDPQRFADQPWSAADHVFGEHLGAVAAADDQISAILTPQLLDDVVARIPDDWLEPVPGAQTPDELRAAYLQFLSARLDTRAWLPGGGA